jgi:hypothetical protein
MKKDTINLATIEVVKVCQPTMMLRWLEQGLGKNVHKSYFAVKIKKLQQMWTSIEWKDISVTNEL